MITSEWQPAVIAPTQHVSQLHKINPGRVTRFAGEIVRVRENDDARKAFDAIKHTMFGCQGHCLEVHHEDALKLWPEIAENGTNVVLCTCEVLTD